MNERDVKVPPDRDLVDIESQKEFDEDLEEVLAIISAVDVDDEELTIQGDVGACKNYTHKCRTCEYYVVEGCEFMYYCIHSTNCNLKPEEAECFWGRRATTLAELAKMSEEEKRNMLLDVTHQSKERRKWYAEERRKRNRKRIKDLEQRRDKNE